MSIDTIAALYDRYAHAREEFQHAGHSATYKLALAQVALQPPKSFANADLDSYTEHNPQEAMALNFLLAHIPIQDVMREFGTDAALWRWAEYPYTPLKDHLRVEVAAAGFVEALLEKARVGEWQSNGRSDVGSIMRSYNLLTGLEDVATTPVLQDTLSETGLSSQRVRKFTLRQLHTKYDYVRGCATEWASTPGTTRNEVYIVHLDTSISTGLFYERWPVAVLSLFPAQQNTLLVHQMQGVNTYIHNDEGDFEARGKNHALSGFDWKKALFHLAERIAAETNFTRVGILGAQNNYWTRPDGHGKIHLPLEEAEQKYDQVAARLGLEQQSDGNWSRPVRTHRDPASQLNNPVASARQPGLACT